MIAPSDGARAVALARAAIVDGLRAGGGRRDYEPPAAVALPALFDEKRGVFVTLSRFPSGELRGCIGFPMPVLPMRLAIPRAAWAAAVDDPRFPPVASIELDALLVELSLLTVPRPLDVLGGRVEGLVVGRDGVIVERDGAAGLLLPQVAAEEGWGPERFLSETCRKAGLPSDAWRRPGTSVEIFSAELFREERPGAPALPHALLAHR